MVVGFHGISEGPTVTPELTFFWAQASKPMVLKVWPLDQQQQWQQVGMQILRPYP